MQCRLLYIACSTCIGVVPHSDPLPDYSPAPPNLGLGVWVELLLGSQISTLFYSIRLYFILKITKQKKNIIQRVRHFLNASRLTVAHSLQTPQQENSRMGSSLWKKERAKARA